MAATSPLLDGVLPVLDPYMPAGQRFAYHIMQMTALYVGQMAPSPFITN